ADSPAGCHEPLNEFPRDGAGDDRNAFRGSAYTDCSTDLVIGAVCLYFLIGLAWTFLYYSIYLLSPNSIFAASGTAALTAAGSEVRFTEVFYFSLSALTTIGSSNEEQLSTMMRQLAVVESAMGQLYLAVLISRLVGFSTTSDAKAAS